MEANRNEKLSQMGLAVILRPLVICDYLELDNVVGCFAKLAGSTFTSATLFGTHSTSVDLISLINTKRSPKIQNITKSEKVISEIHLCIRWSPLDHIADFFLNVSEVGSQLSPTQMELVFWFRGFKSL